MRQNKKDTIRNQITTLKYNNFEKKINTKKLLEITKKIRN